MPIDPTEYNELESVTRHIIREALDHLYDGETPGTPIDTDEALKRLAAVAGVAVVEAFRIGLAAGRATAHIDPIGTIS